MSPAGGLSETQRGVLMSSMSDASCAMTLGRSARWVAQRREELKAAEAADQMRNPAGETIRARPGRSMEAVATTRPSRVAAASPSFEARSPKPEARSPKPEARSREVRPVRLSVNPLLQERPQAVRFAGWFLAAGWRLSTVADLFDADPDELRDALERRGSPHEPRCNGVAHAAA